MIYNQHQLKEPLIDFIESIFHFKGFKPDHSIERVVPTGHVFILFELDGIKRHTHDRETLKPNGTFKNAWVSGIHKDYLSISAPQDSEMLVIQFKNFGAYPFIHQPIYQFNNIVVEAQEIFGQAIINLRTQIIEAKDAAEKFNAVENWLTERFASNKVPNPSLIHILKELLTKPIVDHNTIITSYSKTQKHLINQFKTYFGLTPKVFHRIFRFNEILKMIQNKQNLNWSQIAYEFGYSDQSHFIKEFKEFSGFNPQDFIMSAFHNDEETNFFPLDRKG